MKYMLLANYSINFLTNVDFILNLSKCESGMSKGVTVPSVTPEEQDLRN